MRRGGKEREGDGGKTARGYDQGVGSGSGGSRVGQLDAFPLPGITEL